MKLIPKFVRSTPGELEDGVIYISIDYSTVIHKCCCGCGNKVVTPLSPNRWSLTYDGKAISLYPSIGNWNFPCKSHYWIRNNEVIWARKLAEKEIRLGREDDELEEGTSHRRKPRSFLKFFLGKKKISN